MEPTDTKQSEILDQENKKVDLRKHRKRITTLEEKEYILQMRKKYSHEDLQEKMARISKQLKGED